MQLPEDAAPRECQCPACGVFFLPVPVPPGGPVVAPSVLTELQQPIIDGGAFRNFCEATTPRTRTDVVLAFVGGILCGPEMIALWGIDILEMRFGAKSGADQQKFRRRKMRIMIGFAAICAIFVVAYILLKLAGFSSIWLDAFFSLIVRHVVWFGLLAVGIALWFLLAGRPRRKVDFPLSLDENADPTMMKKE
jgi:hypothetical protein